MKSTVSDRSSTGPSSKTLKKYKDLEIEDLFASFPSQRVWDLACSGGSPRLLTVECLAGSIRAAVDILEDEMRAMGMMIRLAEELEKPRSNMVSTGEKSFLRVLS
jgi:hypothetical protein